MDCILIMMCIKESYTGLFTDHALGEIQMLTFPTMILFLIPSHTLPPCYSQSTVLENTGDACVQAHNTHMHVGTDEGTSIFFRILANHLSITEGCYHVISESVQTKVLKQMNFKLANASP
jgi:hypothetical protein